MRQTLLFALATAAFGLALAACTAGLQSFPTQGGTDGGRSGSPGGDGGSGPADAQLERPRLVALHGAPNLFDLRLCFGVATDGGAPAMLARLPSPSDRSRPIPRTSFAGVAVGSGAQVPDAPLDPGTRLTVRAVDAYESSLGTVPCDELFQRPREQWKEGNHWVDLGSFDVPSASAGAVFVLAITGCTTATTATFTPSRARCGPKFEIGKSNLRAQLLTVGAAPSGAEGAPRLAFVQLSPSFGDARIDVTLGTLDKQPSSATIATDVPYLGASAAGPSPPLGDLVTRGLRAEVRSGDAGAGPDFFALSLADVGRLSAPSRDPGDLLREGHLVVALMGDTTVPSEQVATPDGGTNPEWSGLGLHFVAVPSTLR